MFIKPPVGPKCKKCISLSNSRPDILENGKMYSIRYSLHFKKDSNEEVEKGRRTSRQPLSLLPEVLREFHISFLLLVEIFIKPVLNLTSNRLVLCLLIILKKSVLFKR